MNIFGLSNTVVYVKDIVSRYNWLQYHFRFTKSSGNLEIFDKYIRIIYRKNIRKIFEVSCELLSLIVKIWKCKLANRYSTYMYKYWSLQIRHCFRIDLLEQLIDCATLYQLISITLIESFVLTLMISNKVLIFSLSGNNVFANVLYLVKKETLSIYTKFNFHVPIWSYEVNSIST